MKILYIGILARYGSNGDISHGLSYEAENILGGFQFLQMDMRHEIQVTPWYTDRPSDQRFEDYAKTADFDLVFSAIPSWEYDVSHEGLKTCIKRGIPVVQWDHDPERTFNKPKRPWIFERFRKGLATHFLCPHPKMVGLFKYHDMPVRLMPYGCPSHFNLIRRDHKDIDVSFVGSCHGVRMDAVKQIMEAETGLKVYGDGWPNTRRPNNEQYNDIVSRSKICLNFTWGSDKPYRHRMNARHFELASMGACQLTMYHPSDMDGFYNYFTNDADIKCVESVEEMIEQIFFLLDNPQIRSLLSQWSYSMREQHSWNTRILEFVKDWHTWIKV
jgi:hypothetical protein